MKKIAIIPARSGSKGLPNKNILNLYGKPLIAWTIEAAVKSNQFERIILSTDSQQYGQIGKEYGAEVVYRDENISNDKASTYDVIKDLFNKINIADINYFVLLQPTSPLRNENHIKEAINIFENNYYCYDTLVSVKEAHKSSELIKPIDDTLNLKNFDNDFSNYKRQSYKEYEPNGAIFISKIDTYLKVKHFFGKQGIAYIMNEDDSIDIDDRNDFELAINILMRRNKEYETEKFVKTRIKEKNILNYEIKYPITLIGHSFFDKWNIDSILGMKVNNLGINGSTARLYLQNVLNKSDWRWLGDYVIVMFGANEIVYTDNILKICDEINTCIKKIQSYFPKKIFFINISNVYGYVNRDNELINKCKKIFDKKIISDKIISTDLLNDRFGWLNKDYTYDGLHLNENGYTKLLEIIEGEICNDI